MVHNELLLERWESIPSGARTYRLNTNCTELPALLPLQDRLVSLRVHLMQNETPSQHLYGLRGLLQRLEVFGWHSLFHDYTFTQAFLEVLCDLVKDGVVCQRLQRLEFRLNLLQLERGTECFRTACDALCVARRDQPFLQQCAPRLEYLKMDCTDYNTLQMRDLCAGVAAAAPSLHTVDWVTHHLGDMCTDVPARAGLTHLSVEGNVPSIFEYATKNTIGDPLFFDVRCVEFECSDIDLEENDVRFINASIGPHTESVRLNLSIYMETLFPNLFHTFRTAVRPRGCCFSHAGTFVGGEAAHTQLHESFGQGDHARPVAKFNIHPQPAQLDHPNRGPHGSDPLHPSVGMCFHSEHPRGDVHRTGRGQQRDRSAQPGHHHPRVPSRGHGGPSGASPRNLDTSAPVRKQRRHRGIVTPHRAAPPDGNSAVMVNERNNKTD